MSLPEYNGWRNYPTWNVALWLQNDEPSYRYWTARAQAIYDDTQVDSEQKRRDKATVALANEIKAEIEENTPETGIQADLLGWALGYVDWNAVAEKFIECIESEPAE